ncbi:MAG: 50S ribosome-binding GTPase [Candidatus Thalassarchaeaceae archaeon]|nr:50S ribosome-binding GTPase [Candidatus Thalassarchaeaceae archaeon]
MVAVNWRRIPTVLQPDELMDKAFSAATKKANLVDDPDKYHRVRKQMLAMIQSSCDIFETTLRKWISRWPSLDRLSPFDAALVDAAVGRDEFKQNLGGVQWAADRINQLNREGQSRMAKHRSIEEFHERRRHVYGRCASILGQIGPQLAWLNDARNIMREFPTIDTMDPCIVVAGSPNVGKSALIASLSTGVPEVNSYPFTTKTLHVGHFEHRRRSYQMVDTPGLLDRPMVERNEIEMQAIAALENVGSVAIFLLDPSEEGGTKLESQHNLLIEVRKFLGDTPVVVVDGKMDLLGLSENDAVNPETGNLAISATEGWGLESLRTYLIDLIGADEIDDPLSLPEGWHRKYTPE